MFLLIILYAFMKNIEIKYITRKFSKNYEKNRYTNLKLNQNSNALKKYSQQITRTRTILIFYLKKKEIKNTRKKQS